MNGDSFYVGFYWGPRKEDLDQVALRAESFLACIGKIDRLFSSFRVTAVDKRASPKAPKKASDLRSLLAKGVNRTDIGGKVIPDLGFTLSLWNEEDDGGFVSLRITGGGYSEWNTNICVMHLPARGL